MKATKKIVGAACALVAAVALSAGSTFAWFASNSSVSATNMKVQATVPTNIYIEKGYKQFATEVTQTTVDFEDSVSRKLTPAVISTKSETGGTVTSGGTKTGVEAANGALYLYTSPDITAADKWDEQPGENVVGTPNELVAVAHSSAGKTSFQWTDDTTAPKGTTNETFVATYNMTLANKSLQTNIEAKVTVTATSTETCYFVRTGMLIGTQAEKDGDITYKFCSIENKADVGTALGATGGTLDYGTIISNMPRDTVATITFLVWFDGQDDECKVRNASNLNDISFVIDFTTPAGPGA